MVVNRRYENRSATLVTTNRGLPTWAEQFGGDSVVAAAILDRLLDGAAVIEHQRTRLAPILRKQRDGAADKGQVGRQKIFDGLLNRLDEEAS